MWQACFQHLCLHRYKRLSAPGRSPRRDASLSSNDTSIDLLHSPEWSGRRGIGSTFELYPQPDSSAGGGHDLSSWIPIDWLRSQINAADANGQSGGTSRSDFILSNNLGLSLTHKHTQGTLCSIHCGSNEGMTSSQLRKKHRWPTMKYGIKRL